MDQYLLSILMVLSGGLLSLIIPEKLKGYCFSLFAGMATCIILYTSYEVFQSGRVITGHFILRPPLGEVVMVIDTLSAFFISLISVMSFIGSLYAIGYLKSYVGQNRALTSHFYFYQYCLHPCCLFQWCKMHWHF